MSNESPEPEGGAKISTGSTRRIPQAEPSPPSDEPDTVHGVPDPERLGGEPRLALLKSDRPSHVDGHKILKELGRGGMGVVYLAREARWGREVALKVVPAGLTSTQTRRFLEEAFITGQLQHPAIVPIYRMGKTTEGRDYYTMKRVQGQTLAQILKQVREGVARVREQFPLRRRVAILLSAAEGVAYAHDRGVIHRDLKPSNLMIGDYGEVYVLDWGLARVVFGGQHPDAPPDLSGLEEDALTAPPGPEDTRRLRAAVGSTNRLRLVSGTPAYMSPEQARGESKQIDQRSDVWALGAILYQVLALHPPISGDSAAEMLRRAAQGELTPLDQWPEGRQAPRELVDILERSLNPDRAARYPDARAMVEDLMAFLDGRGRWRLAYEWNVAQGELPASDWKATLGEWRVDGDGLFPARRSGKGAVLLFAPHFLGDVRIEIQGFVNFGDPDGGELSVLLGAPEPDLGVNETDGYCLQFGGDRNSAAKIAKNDVDVQVRPEVALEDGREYTVSCERVGNRLSLTVGGEELVTLEDLFPLGGSRVGLYGWGAGSRVRSIRVFRRAMDAVVSCMAVPDHDFVRGRYAEALAGYRRIAEELNGREEGWMGQFKAGLSRMEANDSLGAESEFAKLDGTPGEVLAQLGRSLLSAREGDQRRELLRLGAARRVGQGTRFLSYVQARIWMRSEELSAQGQHDAAIAFYQEALKVEAPGSGRHMRAQYALCASHLDLGHDKEALQALERISQTPGRHPEETHVLHRMAVSYFAQSAKWDQALLVCERLQKLPDLVALGWALRAQVERQRGEYARAKRAADQGLALGTAERFRAQLLLEKARIERELGRLDLALNLLAEASHVHTPAPVDSIYVERAWILALRGRGDEALAVLAERLRDNSHQARLTLLQEIGQLSRLRGHANRAHDCFHQVILNCPQKSSGLRLNAGLELGLVQLGLGEESRAREKWQEVANSPFRGFPRTVAQAILDWRPGDPAPEPPEPGRDCPWAERSAYFYTLGEFASLAQRREESVRAYHRALIESPSAYRQEAWMSALKLSQMGEDLPGTLPVFAPLE
ncbi:MAG: hypothetical protein AMXMBFR7_08660 [Planctomycetota bacterium]